MSSAQTYFHPTQGLQSSYAGACAVNLCSGVYVDDGGTAGNYRANINNVYRTFCPSAPGQCIRLTFTSFNLEAPTGGSCWDYLTLSSGPTQNSPVVWQGCGSTLPPVITSTDPSGCITARFVSDQTTNGAGWRANITCVPCAGQGPSASLSTDCVNAQYVCDNQQPITANSQGPGLSSETCVSGCAISENYSNWFMLNVTAAGTTGFTITPTPNSADYDFSLYGPIASGGCSNLGAPIRCSYAANVGTTGMRSISTDFSEDVSGDGWVSSANLVPGTYYLLVNQWAYEPNSTFRLDFTGPSGGGQQATIGLPPLNVSTNSPVCANQALQFTVPAVSGATYSWTGPGGWTSSQQNPTRNPPVAGNYSVTYSVNGCTSPATSNISVIVNPAPTVQINPTSASICPGQNTTLTASGGGTYAWSNSGATAAITVSPASTTTYTVTVTTAGCTATASAAVTVNPLPSVAVNPATIAICNGGNTTLTATGGNTYQWSTTETTAAINVAPTQTTTYTVTATSTALCTATASGTVTVNAAPVATIFPPAITICNGTGTLLTAGGAGPGGTYRWSTNQTSTSISVAPTQTTTYTVTATDANGCTASISRIVTVNTNPSATITPATTTVCTGGSLTLTASGGTSYAWSTTENTATITVAPTQTTTYTVTVSVAGGCSSTLSRTITVTNAPPAAINPTAISICNGTSTTLTASGGVTYAWSNTANTPGTSVAPTQTTTYTVTVTGVGGCSATATSTVTVNNAPTAGITPAVAAICSGGNITLTTTGGASYAWNTTDNTAMITVAPTQTTSYTVTVTDATGCTATTSRTVTVHTNPVANILPPTATLCAGANITLTANGGNTYEWSNGDLTNAITVSPATTTTYTVTVTDVNSCTATASKLVTVNTPQAVTITPNAASICAGESATLTATGSNSYSWSTTEIFPGITVSPAITTTYTVTATDANLCSATATATVTVNAIPVAAIIPATVSLCEGTSTALQATGGTTYAWSTTENTDIITVGPLATSTYTVTVTNGASCSATATSVVTVIPTPAAAISPAAVAVCAGTSTTLRASGGALYAWSTTESTPDITVTPATTTTYTVTATDATGCTGTATSTVTVNTSAAISIAPPSASICAGTSEVLTANGGAAYVWSTTESTPTITVTPITTTTYTVTGTDANSCSGTATATITVNALPIAAISPSAVSICEGTNTTLTASGGASFAWSTIESTPAITVSPLTTTTYTVTVTNGSSCSATATSTVTVNQNPTVAINPASIAICEGASTQLSASGSGTSFAWSTTESTPDIIVSPIATSSYTVTITDANNCTASTSSTVTVNLNPSISIAPLAAAICSGGNQLLSANGGASYVWSTTEVNPDITVNPITTTTYTVSGTDANNCSATAATTVTVNPLPNVTISPFSVSLCNGSSATLTAAGAASYVWSTTETTDEITVSPVSSTTYTVTATDANSCSVVATKTVFVNQNLTITITPNVSAVCEGGSTTLLASSGSGGTTYIWSTTETVDEITVSPLVNTTYSVTANDANGCSGTASRDVTVNLNPTATITPTTAAICDGGNILLTAGGGTSYIWSSTATTDTLRVFPVNTSFFHVTVTDANGCTATTSRTVTVNPAPAPSINASSSAICTGGSTILTAIGGNTYAWNTTATGDNITVSPVNTSTYTVTATDGNGCSAESSTSITVNPLPLANITASAASVCEGSSSTLTATGGQTYVWSTTESTSSITVAPLATTSYDVTVTDVNNCTATSSSTVTVNQNPLVTVTPPTRTTCGGQTVTLTAAGASTYTWSNAATGNPIDVVPIVTTTYSVTGTDNNNCTAEASATIDITTSMTLSSVTDNVSCFDSTDGGVDVTVNGGQSPYTYLWSNGALTQDITGVAAGNYSLTVTDNIGCVSGIPAVVITEPDAIIIQGTVVDETCFEDADGEIAIDVTGGTSPFAYAWNDGDINEDRTNLSVGNYSLIVTDANTCKMASPPFIIAEGAIIDLNLVPNNPSCEEIGNDGNIFAEISGGTAPYGYTWSNGYNAENNSSLGPGSYAVTVTDDEGCTATAAHTLTYEYVFEIIGKPGDTITVGQSFTLGYNITGNAGNITSHSWSPAQTLSCETCPEPVATPAVTTLYHLAVANEAGCPDTATITVTVIEEGEVFAPNAFTPDGDGSNDDFQLIYGNIESIKFFEAQIFNRWGEKIFESTSPTFKWNGTYNGTPLRPDVFVYQVRFNTLNNSQIKVHKGSITLMR